VPSLIDQSSAINSTQRAARRLDWGVWLARRELENEKEPPCSSHGLSLANEKKPWVSEREQEHQH
jgi:hypothetical protein